jgi:hypothetical protein
VYKGVWAGRVVAVKIISHDATSSDAVENEVGETRSMIGAPHLSGATLDTQFKLLVVGVQLDTYMQRING